MACSWPWSERVAGLCHAEDDFQPWEVDSLEQIPSRGQDSTGKSQSYKASSSRGKKGHNHVRKARSAEEARRDQYWNHELNRGEAHSHQGVARHISDPITGGPTESAGQSTSLSGRILPDSYENLHRHKAWSCSGDSHTDTKSAYGSSISDHHRLRRVTPQSSGRGSPSGYGRGTPFRLDNDWTNSDTQLPNGLSWDHIQSFTDFRDAQTAQNFWTWDSSRQCWTHLQDDGSILECPDQLD